MAMHQPQVGRSNRGTPNRMTASVIPAPVGGMDGRLNLAANDPRLCIYTYNIVPSEFGMRTRAGYRQFQKDVETAPGAALGVRTLVPWHEDKPHPIADDKLFAVTNEGIWDVTVDGGTPVLVQAFTTTTGNAGWANYTHYTDQNGAQRLFVADEANGLFQYDGTTWTVPAITGVDPANVVMVTLHKLRLWLVERDSTTGWYLDVGAVAGAATPFYFGSKFHYGGDLVGLYNWTRDSGSGVDDFLVAVSRGGDVIPYKGADPSSAATWDTIGAFYIGDVPQGRRIADEFGGNLHLLSTFGLVAMSDLIGGLDLVAQADEVSQKVGRFLRNDMLEYIDDYGWEIRFNTSEAVMMINTPVRSDGQFIQYRMHMSIRAWGFWRGVPMLTGVSWHGRYTFGCPAGCVWRMDTSLDNVLLDDPTSGEPVEFSMLTAYTDMGQPARFKWGAYSRSNWLSQQNPTFTSRFFYDFSTAELTDAGELPSPLEPTWDTARWDESVWVSGELLPFSEMQGSWGPGRTLAVAMRGSAYERATLVSIDAMWHSGGPF